MGDRHAALDGVVLRAPPRGGDLPRSLDCFDAAQFPTLAFAATGLQALTGGGSLSGELTLRGGTQTIDVSAVVPGGVRDVNHPDGSASEHFDRDLFRPTAG
jgi:polyisoprenoid-binding protein YceI